MLRVSIIELLCYFWSIAMMRFRTFAALIFAAIFVSSIFTGAHLTAADPAVAPAPAGNTKGGVWDDSVKPADPNKNAKASEFDDSIRPIDPAGISKKSGTFDDSIKPVDPSKPLKAVKGNEAGATAIEYGKPGAPETHKPDTK